MDQRVTHFSTWAQWAAELSGPPRRAQPVTPGRRPAPNDQGRDPRHAQAAGLIPDVLTDAEPRDKAEVYQQLELKLIYEPRKQLVRAETTLDPHMLGICSVSEGGSWTDTPRLASLTTVLALA
ncbi:hypothetical protein [Streptomyces hygroscopicus]|uniref:hypothetical protein n=1 Tax=Streptomyces hygroscopicus TaxID=1912 RepID=UPI000B06F516|nr:hypothetical protein [Streptomyces sp. NBRC 109436]